jgi:hypothetical protein
MSKDNARTEMNRSFHFFAIPPAGVAEMILELLHEDVDFAFRGSSPALQDETIHGHAEDDAGEKPDHQPIGEHLVGHVLYLLLPERLLASLKCRKISQYIRRFAWASSMALLRAAPWP